MANAIIFFKYSVAFPMHHFISGLENYATYLIMYSKYERQIQ